VISTKTQEAQNHQGSSFAVSPASLAHAAGGGRWRWAEHLALLDRCLVDVAEGRSPRLVIEMPPRHGKSELSSKYFSAWFLNRYPERNVILTSATSDLAEEFSKSARDVLQEWGDSPSVQIRSDAKSRQCWQTTSGGTMRATGVGGSIMGRGADLLIVDDFYKNSDEAQSDSRRRAVHQWFLSTSSTRLSPAGVVVVIATRWHQEDLIGQLLNDASKGGADYRVVRLPGIAQRGDFLGRKSGTALWPERFSREWLQARYDSYASSGYLWMWEALYQQHPPSLLHAEFSREWFDESHWFDAWPRGEDILFHVMSLDPSLGQHSTSDFSALVMAKLDNRGRLWIDADLQRRNASEICDHAVAMGQQFVPLGFAVEANQFQTLLASEIAQRSRASGISLPIYPIVNTLPKRTRIRSLTPLLAGGDIRFRRTPGTRLLVEQLQLFPIGPYDDGPDALEMAVRMARQLLAGESDPDNDLLPRVLS
jgi:predicted phage terminase large subunit-like protein